MDQTILERLNAAVKANDTLYFLGDFCIGSKTRVLEHRRQIRCKKIFALPGNHDKEARKLTDEFSWLNNLAEISIHGQPIVLCHYAMRVEPFPSRLVAPLRTFPRKASRGADFSVHGCWGGHA
jgi:calcineurin-like phosphoesterase family protein